MTDDRKRKLSASEYFGIPKEPRIVTLMELPEHPLVLIANYLSPVEQYWMGRVNRKLQAITHEVWRRKRFGSLDLNDPLVKRLNENEMRDFANGTRHFITKLRCVDESDNSRVIMTLFPRIETFEHSNECVQRCVPSNSYYNLRAIFPTLRKLKLHGWFIDDYSICALSDLTHLNSRCSLILAHQLRLIFFDLQLRKFVLSKEYRKKRSDISLIASCETLENIHIPHFDMFDGKRLASAIMNMPNLRKLTLYLSTRFLNNEIFQVCNMTTRRIIAFKYTASVRAWSRNNLCFALPNLRKLVLFGTQRDVSESKHRSDGLTFTSKHLSHLEEFHLCYYPVKKQMHIATFVDNCHSLRLLNLCGCTGFDASFISTLLTVVGPRRRLQLYIKDTDIKIPDNKEHHGALTINDTDQLQKRTQDELVKFTFE